MALTVGLGHGAVNLIAGDVLLERYEGTATHKFIAGGQAVGAVLRGRGGVLRSSMLVHAAVFTGDTANGGMVTESVGSGLRWNEIGGNRGPNDQVHWKAYRFFDARIAQLASDAAENVVARAYDDPARFGGGAGRAYGEYGHVSSISSGLRRGTSTNAPQSVLADVADRRQFFCSNFVAVAYAIASELAGQSTFYAISRDMEKVSPAELDNYFKKNAHRWTRLGGGGSYLQA